MVRWSTTAYLKQWRKSLAQIKQREVLFKVKHLLRAHKYYFLLVEPKVRLEDGDSNGYLFAKYYQLINGEISALQLKYRSKKQCSDKISINWQYLQQSFLLNLQNH